MIIIVKKERYIYKTKIKSARHSRQFTNSKPFVSPLTQSFSRQGLMRWLTETASFIIYSFLFFSESFWSLSLHLSRIIMKGSQQNDLWILSTDLTGWEYAQGSALIGASLPSIPSWVIWIYITLLDLWALTVV